MTETELAVSDEVDDALAVGQIAQPALQHLQNGKVGDGHTVMVKKQG